MARPAPLSRRSLLGAAVGAAALFGDAARASAQVKMSQAAIGYQDHPSGERRCAICSRFRPPNQCQLIAGPVSGEGWCRLFAPMPGQAPAAETRPGTGSRS